METVVPTTMLRVQAVHPRTVVRSWVAANLTPRLCAVSATTIANNMGTAVPTTLLRVQVVDMIVAPTMDVWLTIQLNPVSAAPVARVTLIAAQTTRQSAKAASITTRMGPSLPAVLILAVLTCGAIVVRQIPAILLVVAVNRFMSI